MSESSVTRNVVVTNPDGVHARIAVAIAKVVRETSTRVTLVKGELRVEATDVLQLMTLAAAQGEQIVLEAVGPDAAAVLDSIEPLFADEAKEPE